MSTQHNVFTKKHEEALAQDKNAILEELDLPPALVTFLRKNARTIKVVLIVLAVVIVAWEGYGEYKQRQLEKSSALLYTATKAETNEQKLKLLDQVEKKYDGSNSAMWAKIERAHILFKDKEYAKAVETYSQVLAAIEPGDSLYPLVEFSLAQAYDSMDETAKADSAYHKLLDYPGFAAEGYLGLGRLYEKSGAKDKALDMYESYVALPGDKEGPTKDLVEFQIGQLKAEIKPANLEKAAAPAADTASKE